MTAVTTTELHQVSGLLAAVPSWLDKALLVEKEIGMDNIYAMISNGQAVERIAASLYITKEQMKFMLTRTPKHRKDYMNARAFKQAESSMDVLENPSFKTAGMLIKEQASAAKHHNQVIDRAMNTLNKSDEAKANEAIIVNNTVVVRDSDDIAPLPDELKDIMEGEFEDVSS